MCGYGPDVENLAVRHAILDCGVCTTTVAPDTVVVANCGASTLLAVQVSTCGQFMRRSIPTWALRWWLTESSLSGTSATIELPSFGGPPERSFGPLGREGNSDHCTVALGGPLIGVCDGERNCLQIVRVSLCRYLLSSATNVFHRYKLSICKEKILECSCSLFSL